MLEGTYEVEFDSPLGRKKGTVKLSVEGTRAIADIKAPVVGKQHLVGTADGDTFSGQGKLKSLLLGEVGYTIDGRVEGDTLIANVCSDKGNLELVGNRV